MEGVRKVTYYEANNEKNNGSTSSSMSLHAVCRIRICTAGWP